MLNNLIAKTYVEQKRVLDAQLNLKEISNVFILDSACEDAISDVIAQLDMIARNLSYIMTNMENLKKEDI